MLNKRSFEILKILINDGETIYLEELATKYNLSERSIRYDLKNINDFLKFKGYKKMIKPSKGSYTLENHLEYQDLLETIENKFYTYSKEERLEYIKGCLYFYPTGLRIKQVEDKLGVSESTARSDFIEVKKYFKQKKITTDYNIKGGFFLDGDEEYLRKIILKFLLKYIKFLNNRFSAKRDDSFTVGQELLYNMILEYFEGIQIDIVETFISKIKKQLKNVSDEANQVLHIYTFLMMKRLIDGYKLKERPDNSSFLQRTEEFEILLTEKNKLEDRYHFCLPQSEILFLTEILLGSHSYNFNTSFFKNWIEIEGLVRKFIKSVGSRLGIDLSGDEELHRGILNHLKPALYRIKHDIVLENNIVDEVLEEYSSYFLAVKESCHKLLAEHLGKEIPEEEVAYLTIYIKMALDRRKSFTIPKNVILVCSFGYGSTQLLAQQLKDKFNINILKILSHHEFIDTDNFEEVDLIITTINLKRKLDISVVKVRPILLDEDISKLELLGLHKNRERILLTEVISIISDYEQSKDTQKLKLDLEKTLPISIIDNISSATKKSLVDYLKKDDISILEEGVSWEEAIRKIGENLVTKGSVKPAYTTKMIEAIKAYGSYVVISDYIVTPHAKTDDSVLRTDFTMAYYKQPITFPEDKPIKLILAFASLDGKEHLKALTDLLNLIKDNKLLNFLEDYQDPQLILDFIKDNLDN